MSWYLFWVYIFRWRRYKKKRSKRKAKKRAKAIELKSRDVPDGRIVEEDEDFRNQDVEKYVDKLGEEGCDNDNGSDVDDEDLLVLKRPKAYLLLSIWSYFEILLLFIVVFSRIGKSNFPRNFLSDLCSNGCKNTIVTSICYKLAASILMAIGARTVSQIKIKYSPIVIEI